MLVSEIKSPKKILGQKKCGARKKCWFQKKFGSKKCGSGLRKLLFRKKLWVKKNLALNILTGHKKNLRSKKNFGPK